MLRMVSEAVFTALRTASLNERGELPTSAMTLTTPPGTSCGIGILLRPDDADWGTQLRAKGNGRSLVRIERPRVLDGRALTSAGAAASIRVGEDVSRRRHRR